LLGVRALVIGLHDANAMDSFDPKRRYGLVDEGQRRDSERNAFSLHQSAGNDMRCRQRFAEAGWRLEHRPAMAGGQGRAKHVNRALLMRP
jgi:hypothetical protein